MIRKHLFLMAVMCLAAFPAWAEPSAPPDDLLAAPPPAENADPVAAATPAPSAEADVPPAAPEPETPPPPAPEKPRGDSVTAAPLRAPTQAGFGLLDTRNGGLAPTLWQDNAGTVVIPLLEDSGAAFTRALVKESAWRTLARRVALTHGAEPDGPPDIAAGFFASRVLLAASAGYPQEARQLLKRNPAFLNEEGSERLAAISLMQGDTKGACTDPHLEAQEAPFWQKLGIICAAGGGGDPAKARLALDLMREAGEADTLFMDLAETALSAKKQVTSKTRPGIMHVLHAALLAAGGVRPTAAMLDVMGQAPYPLLLSIPAPDAWRSTIALSLARSRLITPDALAKIFNEAAFKTEIINKLRADPAQLASEKLVPVALRPAMALRAATGVEKPAQKAAILAMLASLLAPEDLTGTLGAVILGTAPAPQAGLDASALPLARIALLQNDRAAKAWLALLPKTGPALPELQALAILRGAVPEAQREDAAASFAHAQSVPREKRADALAVLQALGLSIGEKAEHALNMQDTTLPQPAFDRELDDAVKNNRTGEVVLRALLLSPRDAVSVQLLKIKTLHDLGFDKEARELALPLL